MITKEDAISTIIDLEESGILSKEITDNLSDIRICIEQIDNGLDLFGAEDDCVELFIAKANPYHSSAPYNTDELKAEYDAWVAKCEKIAEKYKIKV